jgi:hypothetical protein
MKGGAVEGTFVAANADVLVIHLKKDNYTIDRTSIKRLDRRLAGSNRGKNIGRGLEIGFGAGLLRFAVACDGCGGSGGALVTIQSMLIGTLVGATSSATKWETVYRR